MGAKPKTTAKSGKPGQGSNGGSSRDRVARHRAAMRKKGMKLVQVWVPDTSAPGFAEEARRQSALLNEFDRNDDTMAFLERVSVFHNPR